jgi:hypothetical protein
VQHVNEKRLKSPQDALSFAMGELKGPYGLFSEENKILAQDPLISLFYIKYVLMPDHPIPDVIMDSIMKDPDVHFIFVSMSKKTKKMYRDLKKIIDTPL